MLLLVFWQFAYPLLQMVAKKASIIDGRYHKHTNWLITYQRKILRLGFSLNWLLLCYLAKYGSGQQQNNNNDKCRQIVGNFKCHGDVAVRRGVHHQMEHIQGFTQSHWMPPLVKCLHRIAAAAAMVNEFEWNTQKLPKHNILASNYGTFWPLVVCQNFGTWNKTLY